MKNPEETWAQFKTHFAAAHCQHKQMQGESVATSGYHSANAAVGQTEDQMDEATIGALANRHSNFSRPGCSGDTS
jgi:hypothetical protein